jgi:hypothetical protein
MTGELIGCKFLIFPAIAMLEVDAYKLLLDDGETDAEPQGNLSFLGPVNVANAESHVGGKTSMHRHRR